MATGAALLIARDDGVVPEGDGSFARGLHRLGELLTTVADWRVSRLDVVALSAPRDTVERELDVLGRCSLALVVVFGQIIETGDGPALRLGAAGVGSSAADALPLRGIAARLRESSAAHAAVIVGGWGSGTAALWLDALDTRRDGDLIVVARATGAMLAALQDGLAGDAIDVATGTITLRSLGAHLAYRVPDAALRRSTDAPTLITPPPLAGAWDPRLTRRSVAVGQLGAISACPPGVAGDAAEADDLTGAILPGGLRLDARIASGGFGVVYRARQLAIARDVAVKVLSAKVDPASPSGRLFVHEIHSAARIDHPNVVRILQADMTPGGRLFFAMELLAGRDLEQLVGDGATLPVARAVALIRQLLAGLGAAHQTGLVHADVKPANIIVVPARDGGERVVLVDFGLSRLHPSGVPPRSVGGTPSYMAPEQLRSGRVDARSDVFAAALVLVTLVTGWRRRSIDALVPPLESIVDAGLREVLRRALAVDPAARFQTAGALAEALAGDTAGASVHGPAAPRPPFPVTAFTEADADRLFGREREIAALLERVGERRVVVLAGAAGSGRTSLLRAGLVPRLAARGVRLIAWTGGDTDALIHKLDPAAVDLADAVARCGRRVVVVVDPLEVVPRSDRSLAWLASAELPGGLELTLVLSTRADTRDRLPAVEPASVSEVLLGGLEPGGARDAIIGALVESRVAIEPALLEVLLEDLARCSVGGAAGAGIEPRQLQRVCAALYDALPPGDAMLTRARYDQLGGVNGILGEPSSALRVRADPNRRRRARRVVAVAVAVAVVATAGIALRVRSRAAHAPDTQVVDPTLTEPPLAPPSVVIGGSGTVLWGLLDPVRDVVERLGGIAMPLTTKLDTGSSGAIRLLDRGDAEVAGLSARHERAVSAELRAAGKLLIEVAVGFDETALFVHRDNPVQRIDIAALRRALCCARGEDTRPLVWSVLDPTAGPSATRPVAWILFGRNSTPRHGDTTSATLAQADTWFCGSAQLCAASEPVEVEAHEVLGLVERVPNALALSSRSFATPAVHRVAVVDGARRTLLNGRRPLWLYIAAERSRPLPAKLCRLLAAVLAAETAKRLDEIGKAQALPEAQRARQRAALGLDDGTCAARTVAALVGDPDDGIARSPLTHDLEPAERWLPDIVVTGAR